MVVLLIVLLLAIGISNIVVGIRFRLGDARGAARYYDIRVYPFWVRNGAFAMVPLGVALICLSAAVTLFELGHDGAGLVISVVFILAGLFSLALTLDPPAWVKPAWLRRPPAEL